MKKYRIKKQYYAKKASEKLIGMQNVAANNTYDQKRLQFLTIFAMCDAVVKIFLSKYCEIRKKEGDNIKCCLDMRIIPSALAMFEIDIPNNLLTRIFSAEKQKGKKSAKVLRNGVVHELKEADMKEVMERFESLISDMNTFLEYFS